MAYLCTGSFFPKASDPGLTSFFAWFCASPLVQAMGQCSRFLRRTTTHAGAVLDLASRVKTTDDVPFRRNRSALIVRGHSPPLLTNVAPRLCWPSRSFRGRAANETKGWQPSLIDRFDDETRFELAVENCQLLARMKAFATAPSISTKVVAASMSSGSCVLSSHLSTVSRPCTSVGTTSMSRKPAARSLSS